MKRGRRVQRLSTDRLRQVRIDTDYAIDSNSMYETIEKMGDIPLRSEHDNAAYLRDVGTPKDANYIQTNVVRVNGRRQVYIPVFRQLGASTLAGRRNAPGRPEIPQREDDARRDRPPGGHGPVGLRPEVDREPDGGRQSWARSFAHWSS